MTISLQPRGEGRGERGEGRGERGEGRGERGEGRGERGEGERGEGARKTVSFPGEMRASIKGWSLAINAILTAATGVTSCDSLKFSCDRVTSPEKPP